MWSISAYRFGCSDSEREVLELLLHLLHAEAMRERRVDVERLLRDAPSACRSGSAAIVRMLCNRSASLMIRTRRSFAIATSILRIVAACCASFESKRMRSSLVTPSTIAATSAPNSRCEVVERDRGVLDRVVEQRGRHRDVVEAEVGDDPRDRDAGG